MSSLKRLAFFLLVSAAAFAAEEGGHEAPVSDLWKWVNFGIVVVFLGYLAIKTGGPALRQRAAEIIDGLSAASRRAEEAAKHAAEIDARMAGLAAQVDVLRSEAKQEMQREAGKFKTETAALVAKVEANAQSEIDAAAKHAVAELQALSARLALDLAEKKVMARMTPPAQAALVDRFVGHLN
jgi:F0F1-type ATP synthase membrane subunit b/b'